MKLRHIFLLSAIPVLFAVGMPAVQAQNWDADDSQILTQRGPGNGHRGDRFERFIDQLDLSEEQVDQIRAIREESREEADELRSQLQQERDKMQSLLSSDAGNEQLMEQHEQMQQLRQQMGDHRFQTMLQIRDVLTSEQKAQLAEMIQQRRERFGERRRNFRR
jgi:Spy/CpxP family protein refolding chaperone